MDDRVVKATNAAVHERILLVEEMILKGCNKSYIVQFVAEKYGISERQTENYIKDAKEKIINDFNTCFNKEVFKSEIYGRLQDLYRKNYTIQDFRECRNIIKDLREMLNLDEVKQIDINLKPPTIAFD